MTSLDDNSSSATADWHSSTKEAAKGEWDIDSSSSSALDPSVEWIDRLKSFRIPKDDRKQREEKELGRRRGRLRLIRNIWHHVVRISLVVHLMHLTFRGGGWVGGGGVGGADRH